MSKDAVIISSIDALTVLYRALRPTDFSYKYDAKHISTLVVAQLLNEDMDEWVIRELAERVGRAHGELSIWKPVLMLLSFPHDRLQRAARRH